LPGRSGSGGIICIAEKKRVARGVRLVFRRLSHRRGRKRADHAGLRGPAGVGPNHRGLPGGRAGRAPEEGKGGRRGHLGGASGGTARASPTVGGRGGEGGPGVRGPPNRARVAGGAKGLLGFPPRGRWDAVENPGGDPSGRGGGFFIRNGGGPGGDGPPAALAVENGGAGHRGGFSAMGHPGVSMVKPQKPGTRGPVGRGGEPRVKGPRALYLRERLSTGPPRGLVTTPPGSTGAWWGPHRVFLVRPGAPKLVGGGLGGKPGGPARGGTGLGVAVRGHPQRGGRFSAGFGSVGGWGKPGGRR